ncbi:S8 family serine protease [Natronomonas pharaonis DSM 2160]|uniref:S8 family serine protease n=1 Tax=Natronomonas pharaonis (strain ATCC 35678 / DSM 2160 / CIP 103997 / JCM 8858 / NBRC 14720 / NCIMB 2260 / Gabara) TaxID=348780 RepID=A0A1U7EYR7_NATPD|nr:S8 family serine peptidase [Natronomonas pharaonis]CAI50405.1 S8 family serine protease [Natronomonas pharaonis DSM 2160]
MPDEITLRLLLVLIFGFGACFGITVGGAAASEPDLEIGPEVAEEAETNETVTAIVRFEASAALDTEAKAGPATMETRANDTQAAFVDFANDHPGIAIERQFWLVNAVSITVDTTAIDFERSVGRFEAVSEVHADFEVEHHSASTADGVDLAASDPAQSSAATEPAAQLTSQEAYTTGIEAIAVPEAWERAGNRGDGARVAVLDTGVNASHPDIELAPNGWADFDLAGNRIDSEPHDGDGHGTHVSGTVAGDNGIGVAPDAELFHGRLDDDGATFSQLTAAMEWAVKHDADVISISLGGDSRTHQYVEHIQNAHASGSLVVSSAGNNGPGTSTSPADVYPVLSVGATSQDGEQIWPESSGEQVFKSEWDTDEIPSTWPDEYVVPNVVAPGADVRSASADGGYERKFGTSMAVPHASGVAALLAATASEELSPEATRDVLAETTDDLGEPATRQGAGRINASAAVDAVAPPTEPERAEDHYTRDDGSIAVFDAIDDFQNDRGAFAPGSTVEGSIFDVINAWNSLDDPETAVEYYTRDDGSIAVFDAIDDFQNDRGAFAPGSTVEGSIFDVINAFQTS